MKPLTIIYWTKGLLGFAAGLASALLSNLMPEFNLLNGITIALLIYLVSYYAYKAVFLARVEKPSKIFSTGVGAYFLTWLVMWTLFYTILNPTPSNV